MRILFALLGIIVSLLLLFGGYRLARLVIPLMGFIAGLSLGGALIADVAGSSLFGTALGIIIGIFLGLIFALFAYLYYAVAVVVLIGSFGYWLGSSFIEFLGFSPGFLSVTVGLILGVIVGVFALLLNAPKYVLIILTALMGAVLLVGSILLIFNQIPLDNFSYAAAHAAISNSGWWTLVAVVLALLGIATQVRGTTDYDLEEWGISHTVYPHTPPTTHAT